MSEKKILQSDFEKAFLQFRFETFPIQNFPVFLDWFNFILSSMKLTSILDINFPLIEENTRHQRTK